jgi:ATP-binding cassette, subfamily B (MDR/TAP), member 1
MNRAFVAGLGFGASNMSLFLTYALLFWYGQHLMNRGKVDFMDMMTAIFSLMLGALGIGQALIDLGDQDEGLAAARRIFRALDEAKLDPLDGLSTQGVTPSEPCRGVLQLENVTFSYPTRREVPVCKKFSLTIASGEVIAIVGPSGSVSDVYFLLLLFCLLIFFLPLLLLLLLLC